MATIQKGTKINFYKFVQVKSVSTSAVKSKDDAVLAESINRNTVAVNNLGATVNSIAGILASVKKVSIAQLELEEKNRKKFEARYTETQKQKKQSGGGITAAIQKPSFLEGLFNILGGLIKTAIIIPALQWLADEKNQKKVIDTIEVIKKVVKFIAKVAEFGVVNTIEGLYTLLSDDTSWWEKIGGLVQGLTGLGTLLLGIRWLSNPMKIVTDFGNVLKVFWNALKFGRAAIATKAAGFLGKAALGALAVFVVAEGVFTPSAGDGSLIGNMDAEGRMPGEPGFDKETQGKPTKATLERTGLLEDAKAQGYVPSKSLGGKIPEASNGGWISGPQSGYPVSLDGGRSTSFIGHGTEYVARKANGGAFVVPFNTPGTKTQPHLTSKRIGEAKRLGYRLPGFSNGGNLNRNIFLHWSATGYNYKPTKKNYHTIVQGDGSLYKNSKGNYDAQFAHTAYRNTGNVGLAVAAMKGYDWNNYGPKSVQIDSMMKEAANIAMAWGWKPSDVTVKRVMTHAEAASGKDGKLPNGDNYGPTYWGGDGARSDFHKLGPRDPNGSGGDKLRAKMRSFMGGSPNVIPEVGGSGTTSASGGGGAQRAGVGPSEMDLLVRLVAAEAGNQGLIGRALVARSILNRAGLVQSGKVRPGMFNAKSGSIADIIYAPLQYQPVRDGSLKKNRTQDELNNARSAVDLAMNPTGLRAYLESKKIPAEQINYLMGATGFRTGGAFKDASQQVNVVKYKDHYFNTAGNKDILTPKSEIDEKGGTGGNFDTSAVGQFNNGNVDTANRAIVMDQQQRTNDLLSGIAKIEASSPMTVGARRSSTRQSKIQETQQLRQQAAIQTQTEQRNDARRQITERSQEMIQTALSAIAQQNGVNSQAIIAAQRAVQMAMSQEPQQPMLVGGGSTSTKSTASSLMSTLNPLRGILK